MSKFFTQNKGSTVTVDDHRDDEMKAKGFIPYDAKLDPALQGAAKSASEQPKDTGKKKPISKTKPGDTRAQ